MESVDAGSLSLKFWGTRGSLPQALSNADILKLFERALGEAEAKKIDSLQGIKRFLKDREAPWSYGGNTTCTEIRFGQDVCFVDMGSGLREAGSYYMGLGKKTFHVFLTHMHWDHVMGLPFFIPVHVPGCEVIIHHVHRNAPDAVKINFNGVNFPLTFEQLGGKVTFNQLKLYEPYLLGGLKVTPFVLDHPGGSFGFRFDAQTSLGPKSAAVGVDGEYKRVSVEELGKDLAYYQNLDLLVFDAQYEMSELANRFDWGHSSPNIGIDLALRECIKSLALTHHDPWADAAKLDRMNREAKMYAMKQWRDHEASWKQRGLLDPLSVISAYDGLELSL